MSGIRGGLRSRFREARSGRRESAGGDARRGLWFFAPRGRRAARLLFSRDIRAMRKRRRKIALVGASVVGFALLTAAGCATFRFTRTSFATDAVLARGLAELHGEHIDRLIGIMGYPGSETSVAGRQLHVWKRVENAVELVPEKICATHPARASGRKGDKRRAPQKTRCWTIKHEKMRTYLCTVTIEIDDGYRVVGHQIEGDEKGCESYAGYFRRPAYESCVRSIESSAFLGLVSEDEFRVKRARCESLR